MERVLGRKGDAHIKMEIQSNSEFQSLTWNPTRSLGTPRLQIDVQDAYEIGFGRSTYAWKEDEIKFPTELVPRPTDIGFDQNYWIYCTIQSLTHRGVVYIKTDAQVAYDIQLRCSWTPWKDKETAFPMQLFPCQNVSWINRIVEITRRPKSVLVLRHHFLPLGRVSCLAH
jgi:hypothetical protein